MPRLSRTSSASSQSYTTLPSSLDTSHNDSMSYYPSHHNGHHSRMDSLSSNGAGASGSVAYYSHMSDDMASPTALGDGNGSSSMTTAVANQVAYEQQQQQHQHQHDALAVGMPLGMGQGTPTVMSNDGPNVRGGPMRTSNAGSVLGSVGSAASSIGSNNSSGHGRSYQVQMPESALPAHMHHQQSQQNQQNQQNHPVQSLNHPVQQIRTSSGAWSPQDDDALLQARARGDNWSQIQTMFHGKTPNACRKRHERLMERRNANDFDSRKMEHIAREYMSMRRDIWQPLAQKTGEKWTVVEQKCMATGLKNMQSAARAAGRRYRLEEAYGVVLGAGGPYSELGRHVVGHHNHSHRHDSGPDVGIDDELDVDVDVDVALLDGTGMSAGVGSPSSSSPHGGASHGLGGGNRSVSGGSNSSVASSSLHPSVSARRQHHGPGHAPSHSLSSYSYSHPHPHAPPPPHAQPHAPPHHQPHSQPHSQPHQHALSGSPGEVGSSPGYPEYYTTAGFSQSLRAVDGAPATAMTSPYASHQHGHAPSHQPRMGNGDMGIDALLRR